MTDTMTANESTAVTPEPLDLGESRPGIMHIGGPEDDAVPEPDAAQPDGASGSPPSESVEASSEEPEPQEPAELAQMREVNARLQKQNETIVSALRRKFGDGWAEALSGDGPAGGVPQQADPVEAYLKDHFQESDLPHFKGLVDLLEQRAVARVEQKYGQHFEGFEDTRRDLTYDRALMANGMSMDDIRGGKFRAFEENLAQTNGLYAAGKKAMPADAARLAAEKFLSTQSRARSPDADALSRSRTAPVLDKRGGASGGGGQTVKIRRHNGLPYSADLTRAAEKGFEPSQYVYVDVN